MRSISNITSKLSRANIKTVLAIIFPLFILFSISTRMIPVFPERIIVYLLVLVIGFIYFPTKRVGGKVSLVIDAVLITAGIMSAVYILLNLEDIIYRQGAPTSLDLIFGVIATLIVLELNRRAIFPLGVVCLLFVVYAFFGEYMFGFLKTPGYDLSRVMTGFYLTMDGFFGLGVGVLIKYIFPFLIMGSLFNVLGGMDILSDLVKVIVGKTTGGPAKIAVTTSSLFGMVSGSSVANVCFTGNFTIPLMKRYGYKSVEAGAIETCASAGGQIMPPIMGTAAFLMADFTGIPYLHIMLAGFLPATLFYITLFARVHITAKRAGLGEVGGAMGTQPRLREALLRAVPVFAMFAVLMFSLFNWTPMRAALLTIVAMIPLSFLRRDTRLTLRKILAGLRASTDGIISVACTCVGIGIIIGVAGMTGIGLKFSELLLTISGANVPLLLLVTFSACLIFGLGISTGVVYILVAIMLAPALVHCGVPLLPAHFFVMYAAILGTLTPPVCITAYAAATISGDNPLKVGIRSVAIGIVLFLMPFLIVLHPQLLLQTNIAEIIYTFLVLAGGCLGITFGVSGYINRNISVWERISLIGLGVMVIFCDQVIALIALVAMVILILVPIVLKKRSKNLRIE